MNTVNTGAYLKVGHKVVTGHEAPVPAVEYLGRTSRPWIGPPSVASTIVALFMPSPVQGDQS